MDYRELQESIGRLVCSLSESAPEQRWSGIRHLLDYGQEDEAMDVLIATVVRFGVPITTGQREELRTLMGEFTFTEANRWDYKYLSDSEMLDRMIVIDEPDTS